MHLLMCLPPLAIAMVFELGLLSYWWVVLFGLLMSAIQALSDPARQAILSRVARFDAQRAVTLMTLVTSLVGIGGVAIGGQLENLGLAPVLAAQALLFGLGIFAVGNCRNCRSAPAAAAPSSAPGCGRSGGCGWSATSSA